MELGILSLSDIQTDPATVRPFPTAQRTDEIVAYAMLADRLGLDLFALGEHHGLEFAVSSPAVTLAAIAARTSTIRLTSAVTVLSVLDPVRVYQDFASLDLVSHGRAEIIAGRSAFSEPFELFGHDMAQYDALFSEKLDLLLALREHSRVTWSGRYRAPLHDAAIAPRAHQQPLPVWVGVGGSPDSAARAGRLGLPMVLGYIGGPFSHPRRAVDVYRAAGERAGHPEKLRVGVSTHFFAGETPAAARQVYPYYHEYLRPKRPGGRGFVVDEASFIAGTASGQAIMVGSSEELIEKIVALHDVLGLDRFFGQVDWGGLPQALVEDSIARYAAEIAPAVARAIGSASGSGDRLR
jgi:alkanesulfonate monooxygenase SsuD/methylene tetrahydromethanopterin reductase-like flavin-dependent oxidoreductase (luciferase family)